MPITMNHTGFVVQSLERSLEFYRDALGLEEEKSFDSESWALSQIVGYDNAHIKGAMLVGADGHSLELIEYVRPAGAVRDSGEQYKRATTGASHLALLRG